MSEQEALHITLQALEQLTPRRLDPPTTLELTLCLGYDAFTLDEAFSTLFRCGMDEALSLFTHERLCRHPAALLSNYPTRLTLEGSYTGEVTYCFYPYRLGELILAATPFGLCYSSFTLGDWQSAYTMLRKVYPQATHDLDVQNEYLQQAIRFLQTPTNTALPPLHLIGTLFQRNVWMSMLLIPSGSHTSYQALGATFGMPQAAHAIGSAVGANPLAPFIPCHRVLPKEHTLGHYHWGVARKALLLIPELLPSQR